MVVPVPWIVVWRDVRIGRLPVNKGMFAHRIGFENHFVRATVSELAMSYSATSAALTWIPFAVWQATAHESSNVLLEATCEGLYGPARMYGSFILSDSQIIGSLKKNPASFGTMGGLEWHFFDGNEVEAQQNYELKENTFRPTQGGLSAGFECYYTSNYLYCGRIPQVPSRPLKTVRFRRRAVRRRPRLLHRISLRSRLPALQRIRNL